MEAKTYSFVGVVVPVSTPKYINMDVTGEEGFFSMQVSTTGGSLTVELECSNDGGANFDPPEGVAAIISAMAAGRKFKLFDVPVCDAFRLRLSAATTDVTATIHMRVK